MGARNGKRSLQFPTLKDGDTSTAVRNLQSQLAKGGNMQVITLSKPYAPPVEVGCKTLPQGVVVGRAKSRAGVNYVATAGVAWRWSNGTLSLIEIPGLTVGEAYEINLLVVF